MEFGTKYHTERTRLLETHASRSSEPQTWSTSMGLNASALARLPKQRQEQLSRLLGGDSPALTYAQNEGGGRFQIHSAHLSADDAIQLAGDLKRMGAEGHAVQLLAAMACSPLHEPHDQTPCLIECAIALNAGAKLDQATTQRLHGHALAHLNYGDVSAAQRSALESWVGSMDKDTQRRAAVLGMPVVDKIVRRTMQGCDTEFKRAQAAMQLGELLGKALKHEDGAIAEQLARALQDLAGDDKRSPALSMLAAYENQLSGLPGRALIETGRSGDWILAQKLLATPGVDVNYADHLGITALMQASGRKETHMLERLLAQPGVNVDQTLPNGMTSLHVAAQLGRTDAAILLLGAGAEVDRPSENGQTALFIASGHGQTGMVKLLSTRGAEVNRPNDNGATPLYVAAQNGHVEAVKALLAEGAEVNQPNNYGVTPLYVAAQYGHVEAVKALLAEGAEVNRPKNNGVTPLYIASENGHVEVVKALLAEGAEVNQPSINGITPLYIASQSGHVEVVKALLAESAEVNQPSINGVTPLYIASQTGHVEVVKALLASGAEVNQPKKGGQTALYVAATEGHTIVVELLLATPGVEVNPKSCGAPIDAAQANGHHAVVALLKPYEEARCVVQ